MKGNILNLFLDVIQIKMRPTCHGQSDGLCYRWNHAEQSLNIDARLFFVQKTFSVGFS